MFIIKVDGLQIRLPDSQNTFNPKYAFSCKGSGSVGLKIVETGHLLLPIDAEGSIAVSPGENYTLVTLIEKRKNTTSVLPEGNLANFKAVSSIDSTSSHTNSESEKNKNLDRHLNQVKKSIDNLSKNSVQRKRNNQTTNSRSSFQVSQVKAQSEESKVENIEEKSCFVDSKYEKSEDALPDTPQLIEHENFERRTNDDSCDDVEGRKSLDVLLGTLVASTNRLKKQREADTIESSKRSRKNPLEDSSDSD